MRFFAYAPALALASIAAAAPVAQVSQPAGDNAPVKLQLGATENAPAAPHALSYQSPAGVDNSNQDQGIWSDVISIGGNLLSGLFGNKSSSSSSSSSSKGNSRPAQKKGGRK
ncbi:hypothetical protein GGI12_002684 [Dipsacomyces acuminosporus]|nr:hypothetical protein GGI12_002684 [Dipsacomyces acuminosporus]